MSEPRYATLFQRICAVFIDQFLVVIFGVTAGLVIGFPLVKWTFSSYVSDEAGWEYFATIKQVLAIPSAILVLLTLLFVMEIFTGKSPGKWMLKLRIKGIDTEKPFFRALVIRSLLKYILPLSTLISGISGWLWIASAGQLLAMVIFIGFFAGIGFYNRSLHDFVGKTAVFRI